MKKKTSTYITWIVVAVVIAGSISLIARGKGQRAKSLADKYQDVKEDSQTPSQRPAADASAQPAPVYQTSGGNEQENDNYFVKGRVASLDAVRQPDKTTVVWVSAPWCEVCHAMRPFVAKSFNKFADKLAIKEIDFDSNPHLVSSLGLYGTPDFIALDKTGKEITRWSGATQSSFESKLAQLAQLQ